MGFAFTFRQLDSRRDLSELVNFLIKQPLGYPNYEDWVQRSEHELDSGYKKAVLAFSEGRLVGDLIYQPHKKIPRTREIKNIRVDPEVRRRYFANFMLRQAEVENKEEFDSLVIDARSDHPVMLGLLRMAGYIPLASASLYDPKVKDVVMIKVFDKTSESGLVYQTKNLILGNSL